MEPKKQIMCIDDRIVIKQINNSIQEYSNNNLTKPRIFSEGEVARIRKEGIKFLSGLTQELPFIEKALRKSEDVYEFIPNKKRKVEPRLRTLEEFSDDFFCAVRNSVGEKHLGNERVRYIQIVGYIGSLLTKAGLLDLES